MKSTNREAHRELRQVSWTISYGKMFVLANDKADIRMTVRQERSPRAILSPTVSQQNPFYRHL